MLINRSKHHTGNTSRDRDTTENTWLMTSVSARMYESRRSHEPSWCIDPHSSEAFYSSHLWNSAFTYVTWRIVTFDMDHSHLWHTAYTCDMTQSICVIRFIHACGMHNSHVWHASIMGDVTQSICVMRFIHACAMHNSHAYQHAHLFVPRLRDNRPEP